MGALSGLYTCVYRKKNVKKLVFVSLFYLFVCFAVERVTRVFVFMGLKIKMNKNLESFRGQI